MKKIVLLLYAILPAMAFAQGFQINLQGQQQIGMGHTGAGLAQDGASVFFNPGAVAHLSENYVQAGISPVFFKAAFNPTQSNQVFYNKNEVGTPFNAYGVWGPKNANYKIGLGIYTPFGGLNDWGNDWVGKYAVEKLSLSGIYFQPTLSIKVSKAIGIGAGFIYNYGSVDLTRALPVADVNGNPGQAELKGHGNGYGYNVGLYLKPTSAFSIGLVYHSKVKTDIKNGDAVFTVPSSLQANFPQPNSFNASIPLPATVTLGLGYRLQEKWLFALDGSFTNWSVYKVLSFDYQTNTSALQDTYSPRNYKNAFAVKGGAQYLLKSKLALRAGGGYVSTPVKDGYVTPEVPDANRFYITGGLGYKAVNHLNIDLSFQYEHLMDRTQTNIETQLSGTFKANVYIPGIGITYHW